MVILRKILIGLILVMAAVLTGCLSNDDRIRYDKPADTSVDHKPPPPEFLEFRIGDKVMVSFSGNVSPPPAHMETVKEDGNIMLPLIGKVEAQGMTAKEVEEMVHSKYVPDYYKRLTVTVQMEDRYFWVGGEVRKPSMLPYEGETTVLKCITAAGDFTDFADERKVELTRANGKKFTVNCREARKNPRQDLPVYPGDRIEVSKRVF